jgi:DNA polymerase III delta subunit
MATPSSAKSSAKPPTPVLTVAAGPALDALLASGQIPPVFLITSGTFVVANKTDSKLVADPRALLAAAAQIESALLAEGDRALDYVKIDYLDGDHQASGVHWLIAQELRSTSLFGGRRVVTVVHAETLTWGGGMGKGKRGKSAAAKSTAKTAAKPAAPKEVDPVEALLEQQAERGGPAPWVLILVSETRPPAAELKTIAQAGVVVEVPPFTKEALQEYMLQEAARYQIKVDRTVGPMMWDRLGGADASRLRNTADMLLLHAGPGGQIGPKQVADLVSLDRDAANFALTAALEDDDLTRALTVLHLLTDNKAGDAMGQALAVLTTLSNFYNGLLRIQALSQLGVHAADIAVQAGQHDWLVRKRMNMLRTWKPGRIEQALTSVLDAQVVVKASGMGEAKTSSVRWLEQLLVVLSRGQPLRLREFALADTLVG